MTLTKSGVNLLLFGPQTPHKEKSFTHCQCMMKLQNATAQASIIQESLKHWFSELKYLAHLSCSKTRTILFLMKTRPHTNFVFKTDLMSG